MFKGSPCFLVGGGPSLLRVPTVELSNPGVLTMAVNNAAKTVRPDLWVCVDDPSHFIRSVWLDPKVMKFTADAHADKKVFDSGEWAYTETPVRDCPNVWFFRRNDAFDPGRFLDEDTVNWGNSAGRGGARSVMLPALRLLFYLGVRDVFLVGVDFHMDASYRYCFEQERSDSSIRGNACTYKSLAQRFTALQPIFAERGFRVWNCNPDSRLTVFPHVPFAKAIEFSRRRMPPDLAVEPTEGLYDQRKDRPRPPRAKPSNQTKLRPAASTAATSPLFGEGDGWATAPAPPGSAVVVGADHASEWLLPWWHHCYSQHNSLPVCFVDFGMGGRALDWCAERGEVVGLPEDIPRNFSKAWFLKPYALLLPPFATLLYFDLDCEVRGDISPVLAHVGDRFAVARDRHVMKDYRKIFDPAAYFNSGVVAARRGHEVAHRWALRTESDSHRFRGDQELLNAVLYDGGVAVAEIPQAYNRLRLDGDSPDAVVMHWTGRKGKSAIVERAAATPDLDRLGHPPRFP